MRDLTMRDVFFMLWSQEQPGQATKITMPDGYAFQVHPNSYGLYLLEVRRDHAWEAIPGPVTAHKLVAQENAERLPIGATKEQIDAITYVQPLDPGLFATLQAAKLAAYEWWRVNA